MSANKRIHNMQFENNMYYSIGADGKKDGAYCSVCWDKDGKAIRMHLTKSGAYECPACKTAPRASANNKTLKPKRKYFDINDKSTTKIPALAWWLLSVGALIAATLGWATACMNVKEPEAVFFLGVLIAFLMGVVPVSLATLLKRKHKVGIYWVTFFSVWMPAGILVWIGTIVWAIFDKEQ